MERFDSPYSVSRSLRGCHLWKACINRIFLFYRPGFWWSMPLFTFNLVHFLCSLAFYSAFPLLWLDYFIHLGLAALSYWTYLQMNTLFLDYFSGVFFVDYFCFWFFFFFFTILFFWIIFSPGLVVTPSSWTRFSLLGFVINALTGVSWN